ncbi:hypothetical protein JGS22_001810 [Streptomyces sp. P38-E01]|uniref:Uncharacterized protein n=1 Tax=Streptomyces tardus TaxID=2780544 RepID=A0A949N3Z6_9ACTN|nr:hypothetical protein [Streptomyces tardus]MBU7596407.1 hypothetical protein [Streptomyces tardus]
MAGPGTSYWAQRADRWSGRVVGREGSYVQLRPLGGGREWDAEPRELRAMSQTEVLSALVAELNARSRRGI